MKEFMGWLKWQERVGCEVCVWKRGNGSMGSMNNDEDGVCGNMGGVNAVSCASRFGCWEWWYLC